MASRRSSVLSCVVLLAVAVVLPRSLCAEQVISVGGTGAAIGTMRQLGQAFEQRNRGSKVQVAPSIGSSGALKAVQSGALQIGVSSRPPDPGKQIAGVVFDEFARTPFVPVVNGRIPVKAVTTAEVERIYRGDMTSWPNGERIRIILRPQSDIDYSLVGNVSPGIRAALEAATKREVMLTGMTDQENADLIEKTPGAFGFSALSVIVSERRAITPLSLDGAEPTVAALARKAYPFSKSLFLLTPEKPSQAVTRFIAFIRSPEGRAILESNGSLPVHPQRNP